MPVIRNVDAPYYGTGHHVESEYKRSTRPTRPRIGRASDDPKAQRRKKPSNAFFLYRSHVLANNLIPADVKQNDVSRIAAHMWKDESQKTRVHFFTMAEEIRKRQRALEEKEFENPVLPLSPVPELSPSSSSTRSLYDSPPPTPTSPCLRMPPAPKMHPRELPDLRLIPSPQIWEAAPVPQPEIISEPNHVEPLLRPLSEEWYSYCAISSLSFSRPEYSSAVPDQTFSYLSVPQPISSSTGAPAYSPPFYKN